MEIPGTGIEPASGRPPSRGRSSDAPARLYQFIAKSIIDDLRSGKYAVGDRMPAERDMAASYGVSRPVIREAVLALEVLGFLEVKVGSGAYVVRLSGRREEPRFDVSAFELLEARLLFEGEAAALAAEQITDQELDRLEALVDAIGDANRRDGSGEEADEAFHRLIAQASRNTAVEQTIGTLWDMRAQSPECALLHAKARKANVQPVVDEHTLILAALRAHDAEGARKAMRAHLSAVIDHLLFSIEEEAVEHAKASIAPTRQRYARSKPS